jgi:hypothetical protein
LLLIHPLHPHIYLLVYIVIYPQPLISLCFQSFWGSDQTVLPELHLCNGEYSLWYRPYNALIIVLNILFVSFLPGFLGNYRCVKYANGVIVTKTEASEAIVEFMKNNHAEVHNWEVEISDHVQKGLEA